MKIGRNDPCYCGSGRKYKFCHFSKEPTTGTIIIPLQVNAPCVKPLNEMHEVVDPATSPDFLIRGHLRQEGTATAYEYASPQLGYGTRPEPEGYPGEYKVEFTLRPPDTPMFEGNSLNGSPNMPGGSLLAINRPALATNRDLNEIKVEVTHVPSSMSSQTSRALC